MKTIATLATLVSCPSKFAPMFQQFPRFRVILRDDNTLSFEDIVSGEWFIHTTTVEHIGDDGVTVTAHTRNSVYEFKRTVEPKHVSVESKPVYPMAKPASELKHNEFWKVVVTSYELHDECPEWAREYALMDDGTYMVKVWDVGFYKDELDALNHIASVKAEMACPDNETIDFANKLGYISVIGNFKVSFDEDFLKKAEQWRARIDSYGEFAFNCRRQDRKQMREELAPITLDKRERRNRLDYLRWFC